MFDLLISLGAQPSLNAVNKRGLTPLTLAATLARSEVSCNNRRLYSFNRASAGSAMHSVV